MDPSRKRKIRLVAALSAAVLLSVALVYTSFSASTEAKEPSELLNATPGVSYDMTGKVVNGSIKHESDGISFRVADRDDPTQTIPVTYSGTIPDPFRGGREIILTGAVNSSVVFVGESDTLITKCPSKFTTESSAPNDG